MAAGRGNTWALDRPLRQFPLGASRDGAHPHDAGGARNGGGPYADVVASGNEGDADENTLEYGYPALYNECITVSACDENKKLAYFSNNSRQVDVISAGVDVLSTYPESQYAVLSGTSMATPHVAGAIALIINLGEKYFGRTLTESEIYALMAQCCCSLGYKPTSEGHGIIDLTQMNKKCKQ